MQRNSILIAVLIATAAAYGGYGLRSVEHAAAQPAEEDGELIKARKDYVIGLKKVGYSGLGDVMISYLFSVRWLEADLEATNNKEQRIAAYAGHFKRMKDCEENYLGGVKDDRETALENSVLRMVIQKEAAYWLAREKQKKK